MSKKSSSVVDSASENEMPVARESSSSSSPPSSARQPSTGSVVGPAENDAPSGDDVRRQSSSDSWSVRVDDGAGLRSPVPAVIEGGDAGDGPASNHRGESPRIAPVSPVDDSSGRIIVTPPSNSNSARLTGRDDPVGQDDPGVDGDPGEQMLLERDGKFRMISTDDVMADEDVRSRSSSTSSDAPLRVSSLSLKTPSGGSRGSRSRRTSQRTDDEPVPGRSKSAAEVPRVRRRSTDYASTHRLTEDQKKQLERQQARRSELARQEEQKQKDLEEKKKRECEEAFEAWLRRKRSDAAQQRRERNQEIRAEREKNNKNKDEAKSAFDEWLKEKRQQQKKAAQEEQERDKEVKAETKKRSRKEAERAFKKWLRKKHREARLQAKASQTASQQNSRKGQQPKQQPQKGGATAATTSSSSQDKPGTADAHHKR